MAYRMQRQARPSILRGYAWRVLREAAKTLPVPELELTRIEVPLRHLNRNFDGLTLLHVTDLHLTGRTNAAEQITALVKDLHYDLALYTGDLADDEDGRQELTSILAQLRPSTSAYAVLGNHDYYRYRHATGEAPAPNDLQPLARILDGAGVQLLRNSSKAVFGGSVRIIGVDDPTLGLDRVDRAYRDVRRSSAQIMLAHSADVLTRLRPYHPGLLLAGHTHGGQFRLPGIGALGTVSALPRRYAMGAFVYDGVQTYVSRGVGTSGAPARFYCPPEVTAITLRSPAISRRVA